MLSIVLLIWSPLVRFYVVKVSSSFACQWEPHICILLVLNGNENDTLKWVYNWESLGCDY